MSPAFARIGALAEVQPLALLDLRRALSSWACSARSTRSRAGTRRKRARAIATNVGGANKWAYSTTGFQFRHKHHKFSSTSPNALVLRSNARAFYVTMNTLHARGRAAPRGDR